MVFQVQNPVIKRYQPVEKSGKSSANGAYEQKSERE
jgi:hypothetical protein